MQFFYEHSYFDVQRLEERRDTFDLEFQHHLPLPWRQDIIWGLGYRVTVDELDGSPTLTFDPEKRDLHLVSLFVQDEIEILEDLLTFTAGTRLEYHTTSGLEFQPSVRVAVTPSRNHTVWGAVSRAVRTPSRADEDMRLALTRVPTSPTTGFFPQLKGNNRVKSEELVSFEVGYRVQPSEDLALDLATFYSLYDNLATQEPGAPVADPLLQPGDVLLPQNFDNKMHGETYGVEVAVNWQPADYCNFSLAYTFLQMQLHLDSDSQDTTAEAAEGRSPQNQLSFRAAFNLPWDVEFDAGVRYVDSLSSLSVPSYVVADLRLGWQMPVQGHDVYLSIVAQNLFDSRHPEFLLGSQGTDVQHGVFAKIDYRFH